MDMQAGFEIIFPIDPSDAFTMSLKRCQKNAWHDKFI
jgi:hypothetical protein